jgi:hypothetical protein
MVSHANGHTPENDNTPQTLIEHLIAFIQARTWDEAQQLVETHPHLLNTAADDVLRELAATQADAEAQMAIEQHRTLLARCRDVGVAVAFAELRVEEEQQSTFSRQLNAICQHVINMLRDGDPQQRSDLAHRIETLTPQDLPREGSQDFLALLAAWLRGETISHQAADLPADFRAAYQRMAAIVAGDTDT